MGWLYSYSNDTKEKVVKEILSDYSQSIIKWALRGNNLWTISKTKDGRKFIGLFLLAKSGGCYGYKDLDESCGPYELNCPVTFLKEVDPPFNQYAKEWRQKVIDYSTEKKKRPTLQAGMRIRLGDSFEESARGEYIVNRSLGRKGFEIFSSGGFMAFRLNCRQAKRVDIVAT